MESEKNNAANAALTEKDPVEIVPGMTVEQMTALYFDASALREPPYKIYQLNSDGHRYYYRYVDGEPHFYPSVTTLLKQTMPTSPALIDWIVKNGTDGAAEKRDLAAAYGTFMHAQFESLLINRRYDFDAVPGVLSGYIMQNNLPDKFYSDNLTKIRKDVCAFAQFLKDYNVRPLAVEIALVHPLHRFAGMVDMVCVMTDPKTGDEFLAIVDFKSGRKGFYEEHEIQLHLYKIMWLANYPDMEVTRVFNFSPKDWRGVKPTYNLKDQTNSPNAAKIPALLELAAIEDDKMDNTFTVISGQLSIDDYNAHNCITSLSLAELIKAKSTKLDVPQNSGFVPETTESVAESSESVNEYDICENFCKVRNCDYNYGSHDGCDAAKKRYCSAKNQASEETPDWLTTEADKAVKKARTSVKASKADKDAVVQENAAKNDLLNAEIEL